jgi:phosphohistidine phosphatase
MNELYILRHGIAVSHGTPGIADDDRPLTPKGEARMKQIGRGLATLELNLDCIITSPLPRARRTAQIVASELNLANRLEASVALHVDSDAMEIRDWLHDRSENRLMIVGHNPALSDLVGLLALNELGKLPFELKKGGVAALTRSGISKDRYELNWIAPPRILRRLGGPE